MLNYVILKNGVRFNLPADRVAAARQVRQLEAMGSLSKFWAAYWRARQAGPALTSSQKAHIRAVADAAQRHADLQRAARYN